MSLYDTDIMLIEKYLADELNDSEVIAFEKKMKSSEVFSKEVRLQKMMIASLRMEDDNILRSELKEEASRHDFSSELKTSKKYWYYAAAAISLLVIALYVVMPTNDSVYAGYYQPLPENPITRSDNQDNLYSQAMKKYSVGEYENALILFNKIEQNNLYDDLSLYTGNCFLGLSKIEEAIEHLKKSEQTDNEQIRSHAKWYLALAYLKQGNTEEAAKNIEIP